MFGGYPHAAQVAAFRSDREPLQLPGGRRNHVEGAARGTKLAVETLVFNGGLMVVQWDSNSFFLLGFYGGLMGFYDGLMGFYDGLMGFYGGLMGF